MTDWYRASSPLRKAVVKYRNPDIIREDKVLDMFVFSLKYDLDATPEFIAQVKAYIEQYLEYRLDDVKAGEAEMMRRWIDEVKLPEV